MNYIKNYSITFNASSLEFQSTPSVGRATSLTMKLTCNTYISIHALRGEGDAKAAAEWATGRNFNPRPPWGGRLKSLDLDDDKMAFQSTPSVGRATLGIIIFSPNIIFQSTPSVGRATAPTKSPPAELIYFNPRPPWGGRLHQLVETPASKEFQSTPSVGRATGSVLCSFFQVLFQSTPSVGSATNKFCY